MDRVQFVKLRGLVLVAAASVVGCGAAVAPEPTLVDAKHAQERWGDANLAQLQQGLAVLQKRCGRCHRTPAPSDQAASAWPTRIDAMQDRAGLPSEERIVLERYLIIVADRDMRSPSDRMGPSPPVIAPPPVRQPPPYVPMR